MPVTALSAPIVYLIINMGTRSQIMTDLLVRTGLFITLTIGSSALMALPYIA